MKSLKMHRDQRMHAIRMRAVILIRCLGSQGTQGQRNNAVVCVRVCWLMHE